MTSLCIEPWVPIQESVQAALEERPDNVLVDVSANVERVEDDKPDMAANYKRLWRNGRTLKIAFMGNPPTRIRDQIVKYSTELLLYVNLYFDFVAGEEGDIRISINPRDPKSWSQVGTNAKTVEEGPTMNFHQIPPQITEADFRRVALHEFIHALGGVHEAQHPHANIHWDKPKLYQHYAQAGWSQDDVDNFILTKHKVHDISTNGYDPDSIMHYPVDSFVTKDNWSTDWNYNLSEKDKDMLRKMYPKT